MGQHTSTAESFVASPAKRNERALGTRMIQALNPKPHNHNSGVNTSTISSYDRRTMCYFLFMICFLYQGLPVALSRSLTDADEPLSSFGNRTAQCSWECSVSRPLEFVSEMNTHMSMNRIISTKLTLNQSVDDKCLNQTDYRHYSSKHADAWKCLEANTLTHEKNVYNPPVSSGSDDSSSRFVGGPIKGSLACTFDLLKDLPTQQVHSPTIDLISNALIDKLKELTEAWQCGGKIVQCCEEIQQNSFYVCSTICRRLECLVCSLSGFTILIFVISILYFPVVLCFFSPTHVRSIKNIDSIVLGGPNHISIRGWVANFVSKVCWKLFRSRNPFLVLLLAVTAFCAFYLSLEFNPVFPGGIISNIWMCIFFSPFWFQFVVRLGKPCVVCRVVDKETYHHASPLIGVIKQHLRIQPLIIVKYWNLFSDFFKMFLQTCVSHPRTTARQLVSLLVSLFKCLISSLYLVFVSGPTSTISDFYANLFIIAYGKRKYLMLARALVIYFFLLSYMGGVSFFLLKLKFALVNYLTIILKLENIPYLTLLVLSTFYCSKSYYSFTGKYDDLAAKLYGFLKKRVQEGDNQREVNLEDNTKKVIPKYLFDEACREVMPLPENICKLLLRISLILFFFYLVFISLTKTPTIPDRVKAVATFLISSMPYIVEMVILKTGGEMKKLRQKELDEKIQSIVDEYCDKLPDENCPDQNRLSEESEQEEEEEEEERTISSPTISTSSLYYSALNMDEINV